MSGQTAKTKKVFDGRYEILSIVGRGARSVVYRAKHISSPNSEVALKVLIDQKGKNPSAERLRREALAMVSCRHRYVARLDDFHSVGSLCYLAMEFAPESDLRNFVGKHGGKLSVEQAERFLKQSAEGIAFIHRAGIIHRDIKPENILVMNDKEVRITDFGVALLPGEECSIADLQSGVGTMNYMAPEILEGRPADQRSDLYALGVVFYELLSGQNPFQGSPLAKQIDVRKSENFPSLNQLDPQIPKYLSDLILQCMHYDLDQRFNSCDELLANLLNQKSDNFSREQKSNRSKPTRPKTNNIHKRSRKLTNKPENKENQDLFDEFDRLLADDATSEVPSTKGLDTTQAEERTKSTVTKNQSRVEATIVPEMEDDNESLLANSDEMQMEGGNSSKLSSKKSPATADKAMHGIESNSEMEDSIEEDEDDVHKLAQHISSDSSIEDEIEDDDSIYYAKEKHPQSNRSSSSNNKGYGALIIAGLLLLVFIPGLRNSIFGAFSSGISSLKFWESSSIELPTVTATDITFPNLPEGVFSGSLEGVLPGKSVPLTLISFAEQGKLVILLGIEGWTPVVADLEELISKSESKMLKVNSNGILLEMKAEVNSGKIVGYFSNLINGSQGQWSVEPAL